MLAIGLASFLSFQVQPLLTKGILPLFGGGSAIWLTSVVFFQTVLLLGYLWSHFVVERLSPAQRLLAQGLLLLLVMVALPLQLQRWALVPGWPPAWQIFVLLLGSVGLPFGLLSTTTPTVQHWMTLDPALGEKSPYWLFAVSNGGSLLGLFAYPLVFEPLLTLPQQRMVWTFGFVAYVGVMFWCLARLAPVVLRGGQQLVLLREFGSRLPGHGADDEEGPDWSQRSRWLLNSFLPSAALLAVTHYLTVDIVSFPLLWVAPLGLYLLSFVFCFAFPSWTAESLPRTLLSAVSVAALWGLATSQYLIVSGRPPLWLQLLVACVGLFGLCLYFHGELERNKPPARQLTHFYLYLCLGGWLGGIFVVFLAPLVFRGHLELYLCLALALYLILRPMLQRPSFRLVRPLVLVLMQVVLFFNIFTEETTWHANVTYRGRSFYNAYRVAALPAIPNKRPEMKLLFQGTTVHGGQTRDQKGALVPFTYFHHKTGVGRAILRFPEAQRVGVVGLGTGVLAVYGRPGQSWDFFELDPLVIDVAKGHFDNLRVSKATISLEAGDGRILLRKKPKESYDILVLDAFTSAAIPIHLLTYEAVKSYHRLLKPGGMILFQASNKYVDLWPVLNGIGKKLSMFVRYHKTPRIKGEYKLKAEWIVLTKSQRTLTRLTSGASGWRIKDQRRILWTDGYSYLWSVLR